MEVMLPLVGAEVGALIQILAVDGVEQLAVPPVEDMVETSQLVVEMEETIHLDSLEQVETRMEARTEELVAGEVAQRLDLMMEYQLCLALEVGQAGLTKGKGLDIALAETVATAGASFSWLRSQSRYLEALLPEDKQGKVLTAEQEAAEEVQAGTYSLLLETPH